ncbi:antirestriction protein ArdR [Pseudomonas aeruginosa]
MNVPHTKDHFALATARRAAAEYRARGEHEHGVVLIWGGEPYGWKNTLRDPGHERPGVLAVDEDGQVYRAEGGDDWNGARAWVVA